MSPSSNCSQPLCVTHNEGLIDNSCDMGNLPNVDNFITVSNMQEINHNFTILSLLSDELCKESKYRCQLNLIPAQ